METIFAEIDNYLNQNRRLVLARIIRQVGNISVGLIGLTATDGSINFMDSEDAVIVPWQKVRKSWEASPKRWCWSKNSTVSS